MMVAPAESARSMFSRWMRLKGVSRTTRIRGRRSFMVTSAARWMRLCPNPLAMADNEAIEQGQTIIPACFHDPEAGGAAMSSSV